MLCVSDGSGALFLRGFFQPLKKKRERTARPEVSSFGTDRGARPNYFKQNYMSRKYFFWMITLLIMTQGSYLHLKI